MKKNEDAIKKVEVSMLNQMNEKMYVVKVGDAYVQAYSTRQIRLSKNFDDAYRFRTYHSANRIADIFGGEALRVGAYSLMFINAEDNK